MAQNSSKLEHTHLHENEVVRVTFRLHGAELAQVREVRDMISLNSELDSARYIFHRGLEAMASQLASRRASGQMAAQVNMAAMMEHMKPMLMQMAADAEAEGKKGG
ncbi:MAG TPA: hypothetical protein VHD32_05010 [Candidatus Didemnitutus sp.]|nr:hypothetical protein [Candidatus Didemnitutus sp.]